MFFRNETCGLFAIATALTGVAASAQEPMASDRDRVGQSLSAPRIVVTASRIEQPDTRAAARVEVISQEEVTATSGAFATDIVKKNASVDVIQYPGGLSGIGLRGFRPEFSGTNQRVLVLVDGRPAGVTSIGNLPMAGIERIEVLKGSASALYGASAMGGVVNFISQQSSSPIAGAIGLRTGSFDTLAGDARIGGRVTDELDFDVAGQMLSQPDDYRVGREEKTIGDFRQGGGVKRPYTAFSVYSGYGRLGYELSQNLRAELRLHTFLGRDIQSPGAESDGTTSQSARDTDVLGADFALSGALGAHTLTARIYAGSEDDERSDRLSDQPIFLANVRETFFAGVQLQDNWRLSDTYQLTVGSDFDTSGTESWRFSAAGARLGPFSPDDERESVGIYTELTAGWWDQRVIATAGVRRDRIENTAKATPLRPDFIAGSSSFTTTNPRAGVVFTPLAALPLRLHVSAGRGFVSPLTRETAGGSEEFAGIQRRVVYSNPNLTPETSKTLDLGAGWSSEAWGADLTWFRTEVQDKIESVIVTNTPTLRESTYINASQAIAEGVEATVQANLSRLAPQLLNRWMLDTSATYYTRREQTLPTGTETLRNVARFKVNAALRYTGERLRLALNARHLEGIVDRDFSRAFIFTAGRGGNFEFPAFTIWDVDARWQVRGTHELGLQIGNLFDRYYYEKNDYPSPGRSIYVRYGVRY